MAGKKRIVKKHAKGLYLRGKTWWAGLTHPSTGRRKLLSLETSDPREAAQYLAALRASSEHRANAHDLVEKVLDGSVNLKAFYAAWVTGKTAELRTTSKDADLTQHIEGWQRWTTTRSKEPVTEQTAGDYLKQLRTLMPAEKAFPVSKLTRRRVEKWLDGIEAASATRRRYYAALQSFVRYLRREGVLSVNPLDTVEAPSAGPARDRHMTHEQTLMVLSRIPEGLTRAYFSLALGTGMERSALDALTLSDINLTTHIVRARGTKNVHRDRYCVVSPWARQSLQDALRGKIGPSTKVFTGLDYKRALDAFYDAQVAAGYAEPSRDADGNPVGARKARQTKGITMTQFHTLHDCRHTYAVVRMTGQDGEPRADLQTIADQLGHVDLQSISRVYARHRSSAQVEAQKAFAEQNATIGATVPRNQPQIALG